MLVRSEYHGDVLKELTENEELVERKLKELGNPREIEEKKIRIVFMSDGKEIKSIYKL